MESLTLNPDTQLVTVENPDPTVSVLWDRAVQEAVINTSPGPTVASRAYAMVHTAAFDAWAAYDPTAIATQLGDDLQRPEAEITEANKTEAISFAAYRVLTELFPDQVEIFDDLMRELGFDPENTTTDVTTAAGIGNVSAQALLEFRREDGSNQTGENPEGILGVPYSDITGYEPSNLAGDAINIELWTPELVPIDAEPGSEIRIQNFLTPQWGDVTPFALESGAQFRPEAPEPFLLVDGEVDLDAQTITLENTGEVLDISQDLIGDVINPGFIEQVEQVIDFSANLTDEQKLIAEFWEDGGGTSFPPGTWMTFGEFVSARDDNTLDDDVQLFFGLGNAVFDAGVATWESKVFYNYARPVRTVRELGELGLIGEFNEDLGGFAIEAWTPNQGTQTILATDFLTFQTPGSDPSPPFAEYTSGHSAFSAAGAEILQLFTGSDEFGADVTFEAGESRFEPGLTPAETTTLEWSTFTEAADEAGLSRLYGGIHFEDGDINGRILGREVGNAVYEEALFYINGGEETESLDFEESDLAAGTIISDQFTGVTISSDGLSPMIFDTANPTGGDIDLASDSLGNVLILSEDGDSSNPDDNDIGGIFYFDWHDPINLESVSLIDVEEVGGSITAYGEGNQVLGSFDTSNLTDDGLTGSVNIGLEDVSRIELTLIGSGAITEISYS
ncbi:MAG: vanadium-dependent haloperoxidase [Cyanobacteria bacterium P01_A01_bin.83]